MPQMRPARNGMMAFEMLSMFQSGRAEAHDYRPALPKESEASDLAFCAQR
jgi:hypothetical protein